MQRLPRTILGYPGAHNLITCIVRARETYLLECLMFGLSTLVKEVNDQRGCIIDGGQGPW
jgi:hypothetical protein